MSLETQVAALVEQAGRNLLLPGVIAETAKTQIAAVSQAYQDAISRADVQRYVDKVNGDDTKNSGLTNASPYKTLQRAINDGVPGGLVTVIVTNDYYMDEHVRIMNRKIRIAAQPGVTQKPVFTFAPYADIPTGKRCLKRFTLEGDATLTLLALRLKVPDTSGFAALGADFRSCLIGPPDGVSDSIFTRSAVGLLAVDLDIPAANFGQVVSGSLYQLYAAAVSAVNQPILGRLLDRYTNTAGTSALNIPDVFTNLAQV